MAGNEHDKFPAGYAADDERLRASKTKDDAEARPAEGAELRPTTQQEQGNCRVMLQQMGALK